ncbi:hypothetical protein RJ640_004408 [Escallonia rubra]|uniref:Uncharacterized protein n=1 Tax=Escallonia rubra TaxID=112253 RepID=A0AA88UAW9_9ASTE|nr:hypothetical protein RJ640_004408 [Escallonia rubra]
MGWSWRKEHLDLILVPIGLFIMLSYHLFLLYRILRFPHTTIVGYENHHKRAWVEKLMQVGVSDRGLACSVINSNISAATSLSSISLVLTSLIGAWIGNPSEASSNGVLTSTLVYGDTRPFTVSLKYISILSCFLIAFASFVQTTRNYVHANFLISMPNSDIPVSYVEKAVLRGSNFWSVGMRALYFATCLLLWVFGPIPMFVASVVMVGILHYLDTNSTPLHRYQRHPSQNVFRKVDQELSVVRAMEHHERPNGSGSKTAD